jgi:cytochrome c oxidase subunit II
MKPSKYKFLFSVALLAVFIFYTGIPASAEKPVQVIKITAKKFEYSPDVIRIKKGVPVILEFTSLDRTHGFIVPELNGVRATIKPGKVTQVRITIPKSGTYDFHCDVFCGNGHEEMTGKIIVED